MRRLNWYDAEQGYVDEQEADIVAARQRIGKEQVVGGTSDLKVFQPGEAEAVPIPLGPRPWIRSVVYTAGGQVAVPKKPYHQRAILVGTGGVAFDISYTSNFSFGNFATLPGDRSHEIIVYAGQELWMRSGITIGHLAVLVEPLLDETGDAIRTTADRRTVN